MDSFKFEERLDKPSLWFQTTSFLSFFMALTTNKGLRNATGDSKLMFTDIHTDSRHITTTSLINFEGFRSINNPVLLRSSRSKTNTKRSTPHHKFHYPHFVLPKEDIYLGSLVSDPELSIENRKKFMDNIILTVRKQ